jgi:hypothetical protein
MNYIENNIIHNKSYCKKYLLIVSRYLLIVSLIILDFFAILLLIYLYLPLMFTKFIAITSLAFIFFIFGVVIYLIYKKKVLILTIFSVFFCLIVFVIFAWNNSGIITYFEFDNGKVPFLPLNSASITNLQINSNGLKNVTEEEKNQIIKIINSIDKYDKKVILLPKYGGKPVSYYIHISTYEIEGNNNYLILPYGENTILIIGHLHQIGYVVLKPEIRKLLQ